MKKVLAISLSVIAVLTVLSLGTLALLGQNGKANKSAPTGGSATSTTSSRSSQCYLEFYVDGQKTANEVNFTLATNTIKSVFGSFDHNVRTYHIGDGAPYLLESVDGNGNVLGKYNLYMYFFAIAETLSEKGLSGKVITKTNVSTYSIIPYSTNVAKIVIIEASSTKQVAAFPVSVQNLAGNVGCAN